MARFTKMPSSATRRKYAVEIYDSVIGRYAAIGFVYGHEEATNGVKPRMFWDYTAEDSAVYLAFPFRSRAAATAALVSKQSA